MGKATIIEAQNSNTQFENGQAKGVLGKLKGIFADYKHGTRNSDRLYSEELWDNRVFGSEDVMEALETKTLFGELDHPEGDRCETLAKNAAISITKLEKRPEEGVIYGEAEILDTPTGRIVKALADSGAHLGISSRGMGEEIYREGKNIIDPDTYDFITFDVVVTPANTKARVALAESKSINKLTENFKKEINECNTENQLDQLKTVLENVSLSEKDKLIEQIDSKKRSFKINKDKFLNENQQIALDLVKQKLIETKAQLDESIKANEELTEEHNKLLEESKFFEDSKNKLKNKFKKTNESLLNKNSEITNLKESLEKTSNELNKVKESINEKDSEIKSLNEKLNKEKTNFTKNLDNIKTKYENDIKTLKEDYESKINNEDSRSKRLITENQKISKSIISTTKTLEENINKNKILEENNKKLEKSNKELLSLKEQYEKTITNLQEEIKTLKTETLKAKDIEKKYSKLSFDPIGTVKVLHENINKEEYSEEDLALFNILTNK